jgi:DNA-binding NarL/FixJ family response regulator
MSTALQANLPLASAPTRFASSGDLEDCALGMLALVGQSCAALPPADLSMPQKKKPAARETRKSRIFLVDDHPIVLTGFTLLLNAQPDLEVCGTASSAEEALSKIPGEQPDLVITDVTLPGRNGLDLLRDLSVAEPNARVLVVTMHDEMLYAERALRAGARGYLMKDAGSERMLAAIRHVLSGDVYVSERMQAKILSGMVGQQPKAERSSIEKLTDREFEIFRLLGEGKTTKEIAHQLHLSHKTVAVHRGHIQEKLGLSGANELIHQAVRWVASQG